MTAPVIFGCAGTALTDQETAFFKEIRPWGFILFARNLDTPAQIRALTAELRSCVGTNAPILIDQEGGRVARLTAPEWTEWLPCLDQMDRISAGNAYQAMALRYRIIADELMALGIDVNCAPILDVATDETHEIILNRTYGRDPDTVAEMGRAVAEGLLAGGVLPIIKHIPGHGRADLDSHHDLPRLSTPLKELAEVDFVPFARLSDLPMAMTAHIVFEALDPTACATLSPKAIAAIRKDMGFDGLLMTDDLSMKALGGSFAQRTQSALGAGCDMILHCNGDMTEMTEIASALPALEGKAALRAEAALAARQKPLPFDKMAALDTYKTLF